MISFSFQVFFNLSLSMNKNEKLSLQVKRVLRIFTVGYIVDKSPVLHSS